ncbi:hypothetical protein [Streptomyces sp. NPDC059597]|uniref:hypothetical protein n=1 Tax=Streptomyces sp. NPDC059597 TaxID=3346879 RepID=UPI0036A6F0B3
MGWTFKAHGAFAYALGAILLVLTALGRLPDRALPVRPATGFPAWPTTAILALLVPTILSALIRAYLAPADHRTTWLAFRCLPVKVQLALGAALLAGIALLAPNLMTSPTNGHHDWLAVPGLLYTGAAYSILATGELRRADSGPAHA